MNILILQVTWTLYTQNEIMFSSIKKKMIISQSSWFAFQEVI